MKKFGLIIVILALLFWILSPAIFARRHHADSRAQAVWLWSEVQDLQNRGTPSASLVTNIESRAWAKNGSRVWAESGFLVFSNGWASFACHTIHDSEDIGDVALLRTSDGVFYVSYYHFCMGEGSFAATEQPKDFPQFLEFFEVDQKWTRGVVPNKSPEPTAVGPFSSAIAVHVAGRRWLSFLR